MPASQLSIRPLQTRASNHAAHLTVADDDAWFDRRGRLLPAGPLELRLHLSGFAPRGAQVSFKGPSSLSFRWSRLIAMVALALAAVGCGPQAGMQAPPPPAVGVASPIEQHLAATRDVTGRLEAVDRLELRPRVAGQVERVLVADGAEVAAGDVLLELDAEPFEAAVAHAEAVQAAATARADQARLQHDRSARLLATNAVAPQVVDDQHAALRAAEAQVAAAEAALTQAKLNLGYTRIVAPIAGRIGKVLVTRGSQVVGGGPAPATHLGTLVSLDPIDVVFDLDETAFDGIQQRLRASAKGAARVPVQVAMAGEATFDRKGFVAFVDNQVDSRSGSVRLRARLENPDRALTPGAFARVRLEIQEPRPVLLVHERAIQSQLATKYVLGVDERGQTSFRPVRLGETVGELRVVLDGLGAQDRIVAAGVAKVLFPGMPVTPQPVSMQTLAPLPPVEAPPTAADAATAAVP